MTRGSNPPTPAQWNIHGWLAAYHAAQTHPDNKKEEEDMATMTGGWQFEGKERPPLIRICPRCQGRPQNDSPPETEGPDREGWCQDCKEGKPPPGHEPEGIRPTSVSKDKDAASLNKTFFG